MAILSNKKPVLLALALLAVMLLLVLFMVTYQSKSSGEVGSTQAVLAEDEVVFKADISKTPLLPILNGSPMMRTLSTPHLRQKMGER